MIDFNDVRRTQERTFTFFPDGMGHEIDYFLKQAGIPRTAYEILSYLETRAKYPGMTIPAIRVSTLLPDVPEAYDTKPILIISNMDSDDLSRKIHEIHDSPEAKLWRRQLNQRLNTLANKQLNQSDDWHDEKG